MLWVTWSWGMMAAQSSLVDSSKLLNEARTPVVVIGPPKAAECCWLRPYPPGEGDEPGLGALGVDGDVQPRRFDAVHGPTVGKAVPDLPFGHPSGPPVPRLAVAEAQHEVAAARGEGGAEAVDEPGPVVIVEDVEQPAVEHGVELRAERAQLHRIPHEEPGGETPLPRLGLGDGDGGRGGIDAGGRKPEARSHERVLARSTADVEHTSLQRPRLRQLEEGRLRTADVPGRCTGVRGIEVSAGRWMRDAAGSAVV